MNDESGQEPVTIVIFGASGDLASRKVVPALYALFLDGRLPERFTVTGFGRTHFTNTSFRRHLLQELQRYSTRGKIKGRDWQAFSPNLFYISGTYDDPAAYRHLASHLSKLAKAEQDHTHHIFYLATPPEMFKVIPNRLKKVGLCRDHKRTRIVIEKPFGRDLESAQQLNLRLRRVFEESQIYRIDHFLGKETVQNILAFRFANVLFEPIWDRRYIDHIQITVSEDIGVEHRGGYYEHAGALRDMIQNHLLQILCLVAMEPPVSFDADKIRSKKVDVLHAIHPLPTDQLHQCAVRGQYGPGVIGGKQVPGYRQEERVSPNSSTETFAALKLCVDNWRWQDVPFYLRTGKRLPIKLSQVLVQFRPVPHQSFPSTALGSWQPNRLTLHIQPEEGIHLRFQAKQPGLAMHLSPVDMHFSYRESFRVRSPDAYETLLMDIILGDPTLFMRADQVEAAWSVVMPVLEAWSQSGAPDLPNYPAGTWGPEDADTLIAQDGRSWLTPPVLSTFRETRKGRRGPKMLTRVSS
jgi:glucose-6-phosphate 1-dehydrogenase